MRSWEKHAAVSHALVAVSAATITLLGDYALAIRLPTGSYGGLSEAAYIRRHKHAVSLVADACQKLCDAVAAL